jgi:hypothetical protein
MRALPIALTEAWGVGDVVGPDAAGDPVRAGNVGDEVGCDEAGGDVVAGRTVAGGTTVPQAASIASKPGNAGVLFTMVRLRSELVPPVRTAEFPRT